MTAAQQVVVRTLSATDAGALLAFELANRAWFERHIAPRDPAFYTPAGVAAHIDDYLAGLATGTWHPFVLVDVDGTIVGRANLKDIDQAARSAEVGYRVAEQACGRGLATLALRHLVRAAGARWRLQRLDAFVYPANVGSRRVLARCGFVAQPAQAGTAEQRFTLVVTPT
ncbi:GNAT family N-acetyltransferase [Pseudoduganella armeniaca]|uniref:GNAT family N-acetyltransferase n=1 Tax=Pseudoduganella armeniaca TaxID=2072590 RepID=A0A2R4CDK3_9BURK|nr:GNAT family N-acetyltransferase [Pseudoduganella armeniaca]AVR97734.1 GNAT family N-acetyltransferase [Pseudoduganella armeniaca]